MATKKLYESYNSLVLLSGALLSTIFSRSYCASAASTILQDENFSASVFDSTIARYMRESSKDWQLVHFIVQSSKPDVFVETMVNRYSSYEVPSMLLSLDWDGYVYYKNVSLNSNAEQCSRCSKFRYVVGIFDNLAAIRPNEWTIMYRQLWNPSASFVIFVKDRTSIDSNSVGRLLRSFWSVDCANVVVAGPPLSTNGNATIFSYDPFYGNMAKRSLTTSLDDRGLVYIVGLEDALFPKKINNLQGQVIVTSLYRHKPHVSLDQNGNFESAKGMDVEMIRYVARRLNFTIFLRTRDVDAASHVVNLPDGKLVGPIGDVVTAKSEYLGNAQFLEVVYLHNRSLDFVYPYWRSYSVVVVRRAAPIPAIFHWSRQRNCSAVYWLAGIELLVLLVYLLFIKRERAGKVLLTFIGLLLYQRFPNITSRVSERIFCFVWICGSLVICTIYQGQLVNHLTAPPIYDNINTLRELVDRTGSSLRLMLRPYERRLLKRSAAPSMGDEVRKSLSEYTDIQLNFSACLTEMKFSKSVACTTDRSYAHYAAAQVHRYRSKLAKNPHARITGESRVYLVPPIHIVEEGLMEFWKIYVVRRNFPYLEAIDESVRRALEFGFADKWYSDDKTAGLLRQPQSSKQPRSLNLLHMDYTFDILVVGHVVAGIVFFCELIVARIRRHMLLNSGKLFLIRR